MEQNINYWMDNLTDHPQKAEVIPIDFLKDTGYSKLWVEIGFGNGAFLAATADQNRDVMLIGFDISLESCRRAVKACMEKNADNVKIIQKNAKPLLQNIFPDNSIDKIFMNFPDPWPKKKHRDKRTIDEKFVKILGSVLKTGGYFELVTDQEWYALQSKELFARSPLFSVEDYCQNPHRKIQTKYEKKWLSLKRNIFRLLVKKVKYESVAKLISGGDMPHVIINKELNVEDAMARLKKYEIKENDRFFVIKEVHVNPEKTNILLKTVVVDDDFQQKFYIVIHKRPDGWIVKLDDITQPFRTPSVKFAIEKTGELLA